MAKAQLSVAFESLHGRAGNAVCRTHRGAQLVYTRTSSPDPRTDRQLEMRRIAAQVGQAWQALSPAEVAAWRAYAEILPHRPIAYNAFLALSSKLLQIQSYTDETTPLPTRPPSAAFTPESVHIVAQATLSGILFTLLPTPIPPTQDRNTATPQYRNTPRPQHRNTAQSQLIELLLQPLASRHRTPEPAKYRTQQFTDFAAGHALIPTQLGTYSPAYRQVDKVTGQRSALIPLQTLLVPAQPSQP